MSNLQCKRCVRCGRIFETFKYLEDNNICEFCYKDGLSALLKKTPSLKNIKNIQKSSSQSQ